jgi:PAS domain S-box-containing protein
MRAMRKTVTGAPIPANEKRRLSTLRQYQLLDTPSEELFDAFARLAAQICGTPISLISLVDEDRQWFKANVGLPGVTETSREIAFCAHAILEDGIFEVPDARADKRFANNPLVLEDPNIRFYAGVPLVTADGDALGTLCVIDREPRTLSAGQREALRAIAAMLLDQFETRRAVLRLFDSSQTELYHFDLTSRRVVFASEAARRNLGYDLAEMRELPIDGLLPSLAQHGRLEERLAALQADPQHHVTFRTIARRKNGTVYPIELRVELIRTHTGTIALAFATDLTESESARERIELLSAAIEAAQDAVIISVPAGSPDLPSRVVYVNAAYLQQKGATFDEVVGRPTDLFFGPKTDRVKLEAMRSALLRGEESRIEYITYRKDGSQYYVESAARPLMGPDGKTTHFVVLQRDVTDTVLRGMTLELQNERLTTLTSIARGLFASLEPQALVESLLGGVRELSGGSGRLLALHADGTLYESADLTIAQDAPRVKDELLQSAILSEVTIVSDDACRAAVRILGPSGAAAFVLDVRAGDEPFATPDIFAIGLLGQYFAVAVRNVELYGELASRRAAVIELNQVKNDLIAMLAHDFKGPLTTIVGFADVLAEDPQFDAESRQYLGMISSSALRLASLATDTLALSRLEQNELSLELTRVDLAALVRDVTRVFSVTRPIEVRAGNEAYFVTADAGRLRQVFENLIGNAIKYSPGGEVIEVTLREKRGGVEVSIRDRGIGIPKGEMSKLFGRFARAQNARELGISGTGFGLYLARTIVDMHGGRIAVESREGAGSTFRVFLPTMPPPQRTANPRVLLLDADGEARSYVGHTLRADGYPVYVVSEDVDILRALDEGGYDAAIVDVERLSTDPDEFVKKVAGRTALVRLGRDGAEHIGWDAVLSKPFLIKDLQAALDTAIAHHTATIESSRAADKTAESR